MIIRVLVFLLYTLDTTFVATTAILQSGLDLSTLASCRAAVYDDSPCVKGDTPAQKSQSPEII